MAETAVSEVAAYLMRRRMGDFKFRLVLVLVFLTTVLGVRASAQTDKQVPANEATKFDEYGDIRGCDHSARLDNFAIQIMAKPGGTAYVVAYAPEKASDMILARIRDYLVNSRGITNDRIRTIYAGRNDVLSKPRIQLWVVPAGVPPPTLERFKTKVETFEGLFDDYDAYDPGNFEREDSEIIYEDGGTGPPVGSVTYPSLVDVLKHQKKGIAYIVVYNGEDAAPGAWQRIAEDSVADLKKLGVEANRLKVIFGGVSKKTKIQLWVAPADEPPPVTDAGNEPPPAKPVEIFSFHDEELGDSKLERSSFKRLVETLRQFPTLQACVIVTFGTYVEPPADPEIQTSPPEIDTRPIEETSGEQPSPEPVIVDRAPADIAVLVEKWKAELAETHKISIDRFVVLFTQSDSYVNNRLDAWVVPPGARLPNPDTSEGKSGEEKPQHEPPARL